MTSSSGLLDPVGIALDVARGKMYFTDYVTKKLQRANLDGSGLEELFWGLKKAYIALDVALYIRAPLNEGVIYKGALK